MSANQPNKGITAKVFVKGIVNDVIYSNLFLAFFVLSILMLNVAGVFNVPGVVDHPQFDETVNTSLVKDLMGQDYWLKFSYYLFFILDFFWAGCLLLLVWKFVYKKAASSTKKATTILFPFFTAFVVLALVFDIAENINYMWNISYSKVVSTAKIIAYTAVGIVFIISLLRFIIKEFLPTLRQFLVSSIYSLIILVIIGVLLPTAPQVNSIVVDLYLQPWNLLILLVVAPVFAIVIAHYPSYFNIEEENRQWSMGKIKRFVIGIVHFRYNKNVKQTAAGKTEGQVNFLFRVLGICFYAALFYMIAFASEVNFNWYLKSSLLAVSLLVCSVFILYVLKERKDDWYEKNYKYLYDLLPSFYDGDYTTEVVKESTRIIEKRTHHTEQDDAKSSDRVVWKESLADINKPIHVYLWLLVATIVCHIVLFGVILSCLDCAYSEGTVILSLICVFLQTITFVCYRSFRSLFRFSFFNASKPPIIESFLKPPYGEELEKLNEKELNAIMKDQRNKIDTFFDSENHPKASGLCKVASRLGFGSLSNNVTFLQLNAVFGVVNAVFFLILNFNSDAAVFFNAILIILSAMFLYYGILVVITKNYIYYKYSKEKNRNKNHLKFEYFVLCSALLLVIAYGLGRAYPNELFTLRPIVRHTDDELSLKAFNKLDTLETRYYIGSYGGGMKSNAWTMVILNELNKRDPNFFKKTAGISGVSGGTMGMANMVAIMKANKNKNTWSGIIEKVATENILSLDLTHMLGRDIFNYLFVPCVDLSGWDRSSKAMERYARLTNNEDQINSNTSFRTYWKKLYDDSSHSFPILIANTTNVRGNQGMAVSVRVEDSVAQSLLYHGADNILEIEQKGGIDNKKHPGTTKKTLRYYDAMSTSNRFPILSPAAKIETKGHYNDGGIYENSGLLSVYKLFKAINHRDTIANLKNLRQRNVFVSIVNDKNAYIKHVLDVFKCEAIKINTDSEINAILSSISATEMMPIYIKEKLKRLAKNNDSIDFKTIYLPHRFTVADVKDIMGEELFCNSKANVDSLLHSIVIENNKDIKSLIESNCTQKSTPIIEPPMSRVMAKPAYKFMLQMLKHPITEDAINKIINK